VSVFQALLRRHQADTESPCACQLRDCLAFSLLAGYDGYSVWPASAARELFQENVVWHGMVSGTAAATAQREATAGFHAELRAALEWRCNLEINDIQRQEGAGAGLASLRSLLTEALDRDTGILQLASPYTVFIHGC
jgi:hypothetical protein